MPKPGQRSLTISEEVYQKVKKYFGRNQQALKSRRINSLPGLFQAAVLEFIGETEEDVLQPSLRVQLLRGFSKLLSTTFSNTGYTYSASYILNESLRFIKEERTRGLQSQTLRSLTERSEKLSLELEELLKHNVVSEQQERRITAILIEAIASMSEYSKNLSETVRRDLIESLPDAQAVRLLSAIQSFYNRFLSIFAPYATIAMLLTDISDRVYQVEQQLDFNVPDSLAATVAKIEQGLSKIVTAKS